MAGLRLMPISTRKGDVERAVSVAVSFDGSATVMVSSGGQVIMRGDATAEEVAKFLRQLTEEAQGR